ncbi:MAG: primosomal protein N' [Hyphomicrobiales bacterium]
MSQKTLFVNILLPLPIKGVFTYRVPRDLENIVAYGKRAVVQFGAKKIYAGLITEVHEDVPQHEVKYIIEVLDDKAVVNDIQMKFWNWISEYYMSELGEVMNAALPSAYKLASESRVVLHPDYICDKDILTDYEFLIIEALMVGDSLSLSDISNILGFQKIMPIITSMIEKNWVIIEEDLKERITPKKANYISLSEDYQEEEKLKELFEKLQKRAYKQLEVLMSFISISGFYTDKKTEVARTRLTKAVDSSDGAVRSLISKGIFVQNERVESRLQSNIKEKNIEDINLSEAQDTALNNIISAFKEKNVTLLHGVTGSGKTEIYLHLINDVLKEGKQVLFMLPEIALTSQIIDRIKSYFGEHVGVYHSKYNIQERAETWKDVLNNGENSYKLIVGPRSALFLPFSNLGLIIVDEEHDNSYKQQDPAPRYNARDAAIFLASLHKAKVILGSATPGIETYYNSRHNKYGLVELNERYGGLQLPEVLVADVKRETRRKTMSSHFSSFLMGHIKEALKNHEQIILFQNRRGFSLRLECDICNWIPNCIRCDVSMIYHKHSNQLKCHYCNYTVHVPGKCGNCGSHEVKMKGFGTEKVEDELAMLLPEASIKRMDLDTTRNKNAFNNLLMDFQNHKIDILVGTQMVTKGLDFNNVSLVGILNADNMLSFPDFRSYERAYQTMAQVSGRAGRKKKRGKVIIQTFQPYHQAIRDVMENNYMNMYQSQILERRNFHYPPFFRVIEIKMRHKNSESLFYAANELADMLRQSVKVQILGPVNPMVPRIRNFYIKSMIIKLPRDSKLLARKEIIRQRIYDFKSSSKYKSCIISIDVDPQ